MHAVLQNATRISNNRCEFIFRQELYRLIYCESGVYWVILPVSIYMCTIRLEEFTVAWQNSKSVSCKMHAFLQNAISFAWLFSGFIWTNIRALHIQNSVVYLYDARVTCFARHMNWETQLLNMPYSSAHIYCSVTPFLTRCSKNVFFYHRDKY